MKLKKLKLLKVVILATCACISSISTSFYANNQVHDEIWGLDEENAVVVPQESFFSKNKRNFLGIAGTGAAIGLTAFGIRHYSNQSEDQSKLTGTPIKDLERQTGEMLTGTRSLSLIPFINLAVKQFREGLAGLDSPEKNETGLSSADTSKSTTTKKTPGITIAEVMARIDKSVDDNVAQGDVSLKEYKDEYVINKPLQELRQGLEATLSHEHDITKEELHNLVTTVFKVAQTYLKNHKDELIQELVKFFSTNNKKEDPTREEIKPIIEALIDSFIFQAPQDWVDVLEKSAKILTNRIISLLQGKEKTLKQLQERLEKLDKHVALIEESLKNLTTTDGQNIISDLKTQRVPKILAALIKEIPFLNDLFPELRDGVIPTLIAPLCECMAKMIELVKDQEQQTEILKKLMATFVSSIEKLPNQLPVLQGVLTTIRPAMETDLTKNLGVSSFSKVIQAGSKNIAKKVVRVITKAQKAQDDNDDNDDNDDDNDDEI